MELKLRLCCGWSCWRWRWRPQGVSSADNELRIRKSPPTVQLEHLHAAAAAAAALFTTGPEDQLTTALAAAVEEEDEEEEAPPSWCVGCSEP
ncbi:hypothetical protein INR49_010115 [Caranx melampygus]|nr:hypothetical protein INR49_010115 [Caranx melampygus]